MYRKQIFGDHKGKLIRKYEGLDVDVFVLNSNFVWSSERDVLKMGVHAFDSVMS